jgi:AraC-like DNA-binding protein
LEQYGHDPEPVFEAIGLDPAFMRDPDARYPFLKIEELWNRADELIEDPCFGLRAAEFWHPSQFGALGYAWLASTSLRTALRRLVRFLRIVTEGGELVLEEGRDMLTVVFDFNYVAHKTPARPDAAMAILMAMCRINYGAELNPQSVTLVSPPPPCSGDFFALFRCPVQFDAPRDSLGLSLEAADKPLTGANPRLAQLNDQLLIEDLARLDRDKVTERARAAIIEQLPSGHPSQDSVAATLNLSLRRLQRRLKDEGMSFRELLDDTRQRLATQYLRDSSRSVNEVTFLLGFSEPSNFCRAFKRWTGMAPAQYRETAAGD